MNREDSERGRTDWRAWARALLPGYVAAALVVPAFWLGARYDFIAEVPFPLLFGALALGILAASLAKLVWPPGGSLLTMVLRGGVVFAVTGFIMYLVGWGAVLSIGLLFVAADEIRVEGWRASRVATAWTIVVLALGELAVAAEVFETLVPHPQGYGLAGLLGLGVCLIIAVLGLTARDKERFEGSLRHSEERLRALVQHASDAIIVMQADGLVVYSSPATERVLGYPPGQLERLGGSTVHPDHLERAREFFAGLIGTSHAVAWIELPLRHADGSYRWMEVGVSNRLEDPSVGGMVCNMRDVTERRSAQEQLTFQAYHDALTKLPNRWAFLEHLEQTLFDAATSRRFVAVLFLDVDRFKLVNDSLGHDLGDRMLIAVSERLATCVRPADVVARFGGDEFTILLGNLPNTDVAIGVADRITERMREPIVIGDHELFISASIGIAITPGGAERAGDLLRQADLAMYVAKEKGRSRWELFDPGSAPEVMERLELEGDLWRALENNELKVVFQPEVELSSGRVIAAEALVRWEHPRRGILEPDTFVPFAEESSLIVAIDQYVLREACRWARKWSAARPNGQPLVVSVNLSPRFMRQHDVVAGVTEVLRGTGVDPRCIQIEITERTAITDLETTCVQLHQLRALGVRVAIDDFGTGYSSLSYLKELPIDVLKLDRSFLDGIESRPTDVAIVQAVVTMGHALGVKVTAEGVERPEQAAQLRALGCDSAMGWLWSKALPAEDLASRAANGYPVDSPEDSPAEFPDGVVLQMRRS